jgi:hypothetical protein
MPDSSIWTALYQLLGLGDARLITPVTAQSPV